MSSSCADSCRRHRSLGCSLSSVHHFNHIGIIDACDHRFAFIALWKRCFVHANACVRNRFMTSEPACNGARHDAICAHILRGDASANSPRRHRLSASAQRNGSSHRLIATAHNLAACLRIHPYESQKPLKKHTTADVLRRRVSF